MKTTRAYLIGMGCDIKLANFLSKRHELDILRGLTLQELKDVGLRDAVAQDIKKGRPPIPPTMLDSILQKNLRLCCVCYSEDRSVILHHIKPYAKEKKHEESNLAVLCIQCHGKAHTQHGLEQNLDESQLLTHKKSWEAAVAHRKKWVLASAKHWNSETRWDWINLERLQTTIAVIVSPDRALPMSDERRRLEKAGLLMQNGYEFKGLAGRDDEGRNFFTNVGGIQIYLTAYLTQLIEWLANQVPVLDATDFCDNPALLAKILRKEMHFCVGVEFLVKTNPPNEPLGIGRNKKVTVEFVFDKFGCTTSTSRIITYGQPTQLVAFGTLRSAKIDPYNGDLLISMSPLGLAQKFSPNDYFEPGYFV